MKRAEMAEPKLAEIASRINAHLKRFESDPEINRLNRWDLRPYYNAFAVASGSRVLVTYVSYQGVGSLRKAAALEYLRGLDAGFVGEHYGYFRKLEAATLGGDDGR